MHLFLGKVYIKYIFFNIFVVMKIFDSFFSSKETLLDTTNLLISIFFI